MGAPAMGGTTYGTIGQVGATGPSGTVTNIPSTNPISPATIQPTLPSAPGATAPNTAPLTGSPTLAPPPVGNDRAPVGQPRLESGSIPAIPSNTTTPNQAVAPPPTLTPANSVAPPASTTPPQWQLQNPADSTALIRPRTSPPANESKQQDSAPTSESIFDNDNFTRAEPIEAPVDYVAPYGRQTYFSPRTTPVTKPTPNASQTPPRYNHSDLTTVSTRTRGATPPPHTVNPTPQRRAFISQPTTQTRDTTWLPAPSRSR